MPDRSLSWIGYFPPAVDVANTVVDSPAGPVDLLETEGDLGAWIAAERAHLSLADAAAGHLAGVRDLRKAVRETLFAAVAGRSLPAAALELLNRASEAVPTYPHLHADGSRETIETTPNEFVRFAAAVARSLIELVSSSDRDQLAVCGAPSCGMFFLRDDPRQRWCTSTCGNHAPASLATQHAHRQPADSGASKATGSGNAGGRSSA